MFRYTHTNIIAKDCTRLINFYKKVFHCRSIGEKYDSRGDFVDKMAGISNAHIVGENLVLPGYGEDGPKLEILSYDEMVYSGNYRPNRCGIAHLAFEVDDAEKTLHEMLQEGGSQIGELIKAEQEDGKTAVLVYAADCEGNIVELQSFL